MQTRIILHSALALMLAAPLAAQATPLGTRAGEWKNNSSITIHGVLKLFSRKKLDQMPPEARKKVLAYLKEKDGKPDKQSEDTCILQTDTVKSILNRRGKKSECTRHIIKQTRDSAVVSMRCHNAKMGTYTGFVHMRALSATHVVSTMDMTNTKGVKVHGERDSRWVSATCAKP